MAFALAHDSPCLCAHRLEPSLHSQHHVKSRIDATIKDVKAETFDYMEVMNVLVKIDMKADSMNGESTSSSLGVQWLNVIGDLTLVSANRHLGEGTDCDASGSVDQGVRTLESRVLR